MIKNLEEKCKHELLRFIGNQEGVGNLNDFPYCIDCNTRREITDKYRQVLKDVYELKHCSF